MFLDNMKRTTYVTVFILLCLASICLQSPISGATGPTGWPHDKSDLAPDPAVTYGVLPNGFRYAIRPNTEPAGGVSLRILFRTGSLMETERQRGLAHFLEHLAFNGTTHYPAAGQLDEYIQRIGAEFNAHTFFEKTVYDLDLRQNAPERIRDGLQIFRDYAGGILLQEDEIEQERGIILAEKRQTADDWSERTFNAWLRFLFPDTRVPNCMIIGEEEVIRNATRQDFLEYYTTWYTPDRMFLVVVGEVSPDQIAPLIAEFFGDLQQKEPISDPDLGTADIQGVSATLHMEPEAPETRIEIWSGRPFIPELDTRERRLDIIRLNMANAILSERFDDLHKQEAASLLGAGISSGNLFKLLDTSSLALSCQPDQWEVALHSAEQELRRALEFGFTEAEVEEQKAIWRNAAEESVKSASTRHSAGLADDMVEAFMADEVFLSPETALELVREAVDGLTPDILLERFRRAWQQDGRKIFVSGNLRLENAEQTILTAYQQSQQIAVTPPTAQQALTFAYTDFGAPGQIASRTDHADLELTQIVFANNVRLNLKPTDFKSNEILVEVRFGSGLLSLPEDKPGLQIVTENVLLDGGLEAHSLDDLERLRAGKSFEFNFSVTEDAFVFNGGSSSDDLQDLLQHLCAYLIAPGYREESFRMFQRGLEPWYNELEHTIGGVIDRQVRCFLRSGDARFCAPPIETLRQRTLQEVAEWLADPLRVGYLELSLIGDFETDAVLPLAALTFGALPSRDAAKPSFDKARQVRFVQGTAQQAFSFQTNDPKAAAGVFWPTEDRSNVRNVYHLNVLAAILGDRLRVTIRENMGAAYMTEASNDSSQTFPGFGFMQTLAIVAPDAVEQIGETIVQIAGELARNGAAPDEFERALAPIRKGLQQAQETNGYWLSYISGSQEFPAYLEELRTIVREYDTVSLDTVNALAAKYLSAVSGVRIMIVPNSL